MRQSYRNRGVILVLLLGVLSMRLAGQEPKSPALARELGRLMAERKTTVIAAKDGTDGTFVAASFVPDVQLLVISARYSVPVILEGLLAQRKYAEIYAELNGASTAPTRLFIHDLGADGLLSEPRADGRFDIVYERAVKTTKFDGDWKAENLTEAQYRAAYQKFDGRYVQILKLLIAEMKRAD
jgi:hypothetical protein